MYRVDLSLLDYCIFGHQMNNILQQNYSIIINKTIAIHYLREITIILQINLK